MYLRFFEAPNDDIVESFARAFDNTEMAGLLAALPSAMVAMLNNMPEKTHEDPDLDEPRRTHLNSVINLATLLIDITKVYTVDEHRTLDGFTKSMENLLAAADALRQLQKEKDIRIAETHAKFGEHFGSLTGFQTTNYNEDAERILAYVQKNR